MGSLFYELHDAHQAAGKAACLESMPEAMVERCRLAGEVQHQFLDHETRSQNCLDKLLGFLETDSIPVCCCFCMSSDHEGVCCRNPTALFPLQWSCFTCGAAYNLLESVRVALPLCAVRHVDYIFPGACVIITRRSGGC